MLKHPPSLANIDLSTLPTDVAALHDIIQAQLQYTSMLIQEKETLTQQFDHEKKTLSQLFDQEKVALLIQIKQLIEQIILARHARFGSSSEKSTQADLFNEAEALTDNDDPLITPAVVDEGATTIPKLRGKRSPLPAALPRIEIIHDLADIDQQCVCGCRMQQIGEHVSEQIDIVPMQVRVLRHIRRSYACRCGDSAPKTAAMPPQPIPKSNASPSLLAMLLTVKYVDGLPLHRFERVLTRHQIDIPRQTLARWVIQCAAALQPLHNLMRDHLLAHDIIHCDETVVQVLKEPDKPPTSNAYMWVQVGGGVQQPVILFDYDAHRSQEVPVRLLDGWQGYLMTDGYTGYNRVVAQAGITHLCCMAHARRKFVDAKAVQPKGKVGKADMALAQIAKLYAVEAAYQDATPEIRYQQRQAQSVPILETLRRWMDESLHQQAISKKSKLGEALHYMDRYWSKLTGYTTDGRLPIDNNRAENAIRPFVIGRKNWLFSDTVRGAHASALIYSLVETAKANGLEPYAWLNHVLTHLPRAQTVEEIEKLLPWRVDALAILQNVC